MIKQLLTLAALTFSLSASAQTHPLWMRYSAISPDGSTIAFSYKGDIYTVPVGGGNARQLTSNAAYDAYPVWSPDGQNIDYRQRRRIPSNVPRQHTYPVLSKRYAHAEIHHFRRRIVPTGV